MGHEDPQQGYINKGAIGADPKAFKPGLYRHYKGGLYTAICLVTHHESREPMVLYVSHTYGGMNVRPLVGYPGDYDGWNDIIEVGGVDCQRFYFLGELPSTETIENRSRLAVGAGS